MYRKENSGRNQRAALNRKHDQFLQRVPGKEESMPARDPLAALKNRLAWYAQRRQDKENEALQQKEETQEDQQNRSTSVKPKKIAGDVKGKKIVRIAWTIDDGPQKETQSMLSAKGLGDIKSVTWYVQRNRIRTKDYDLLRSIQKEGGEIAIHSFHPTADHAAWFPIANQGSGAYSFPYAAKTQEEIMQDLASFVKDLKDKGITAKFVRLPGGLFSELKLYAKSLGIKDSSAVAEKIRKGEDVSGFGDKAKCLERDYRIMKEHLSKLDLILWGGGTSATEIKPQSWTAESSGVAARTDNVTSHVSDARKGLEKGGVFERLVAEMKEGATESMVILAHDSNTKDVAEVNSDINQIESFASKNGVKIEYYTMSELFKVNTGHDPLIFDLNYK